MRERVGMRGAGEIQSSPEKPHKPPRLYQNRLPISRLEPITR